MKKLKKRIKRFLKVAYKSMQMHISTELAYRWQVAIWALADTVRPLFLIALWGAVAKSGYSDLTLVQVTSYFFLVSIVTKLTRDWSNRFVSRQIVTGEFSKYLLKPFNYLAEVFGISMGTRVIRLLVTVAVLSIAYIFFSEYIFLDLSYINILLFIGALLLGFIINFLLGNIFALLAFFIKQILGLRALYENLVTILSGEVIPLSVFPIGVIFILELLPFRYSVSFPIEILIGMLHWSEIQIGFGIAIMWVVILLIIYKLLFKSAIRRYEAEGI